MRETLQEAIANGGLALVLKAAGLAICYSVFLLRVVKHRHFPLPPASFPLLLIFLVYLLNVGLAAQSYIPLESANLSHMAICFFVFPFISEREAREKVMLRLRILLRIFIFGSAVIAVVGLFLFAFNLHGSFVSAGIISAYGMFEKRLWIFYNPNAGATVCLISIWATLALWLHDREEATLRPLYHIIYFLQILLQVAVFVLMQSRGNIVMLLSLIFMICSLLFLPSFLGKIPFLQRCKQSACLTLRLTLSLALVIMIWLSLGAVSRGLRYVPNFMQSEVIPIISSGSIPEEGLFLPLADPDAEIGLRPVKDLFRDNVRGHSYSGRYVLGMQGLRYFVQSPFIGRSMQQIRAKVPVDLPVNSLLSYFGGGFHNIYVSLLVYTGAFGFLCFAVFILWLLRRIFLYIRITPGRLFEKTMMLLIPALLLGDLFETRLLFIFSTEAIVFWILLGFVLYWLREAGLINRGLFLTTWGQSIHEKTRLRLKRKRALSTTK